MHRLRRDDQSEQQVRRLKRALVAVTRCGQALMHASDERHLIKQTCNIIVQAGFHFAWVGIAEPGGEKIVRPIAWSGHEAGYLSHVKMTWSDSILGHGPAGNAIRTGRPRVVQDVAKDPDFGPWHMEAKKRGYRSVCALPLLVNSVSIGCLSIYANEPHAFDDHQIELFATFAETLSYGIKALRLQKDQRDVQERLRQAEEVAYLAAQAAGVGTWDWDMQTNEIQWSETTKALFGLSGAQDMTYELFLSMVHPEDRENLEQAVRKALEDKSDYRAEARILHRNGQVRWMSAHGKAFHNDQGKPVRMRGITVDTTEQHRAEQERQKLVAVVQHSPDFIGIATPEGQVLFVNQAGQKMLGIESDAKVTSSQIWDYFLPEEGARFAREALPVILSGKPWHGEIALKHFVTSEPFPVDMRAFGILDGQGRVVGLANVSRDIGERKRVEEAVHESEDRYRDLVEHSNDLICTHDLDGKVLSANAAATKFTGYSEDELRRMNLRDLLAPQFRDQFENYRDEIQAKGAATGFMLVQTKSGERRTWEYANSLRTREGAAPIVRGMARDITAQKRSEMALRQAEEKYRTIFEEAVIGIFQATPEGRYLSVNPELARMMGYRSAEELIAEVSDLGTQAYVDSSQREEFKRLLEESGVVRDFEYQVYHRDGSKVWLSQNARTVRDAKGELLYYEGTVENITERKGLEEQLRQSQRLEAIGQLAGGVAHDFNNLLGVIMGYCELLRGKIGRNETLLSDVAHIHRAADSAATLTRQLLAFSRKQVFQSKVVDLNGVMRDVSKMLQRLIGDDVELVIEPGTRLEMIKADPGQIEQVIMNLAVNARDAMPQGGKLVFETSNAELDEAYAHQHPPTRAGRYILLKVSDTGCGMGADTLSHIFEPFFTTKEMGKGIGLGLSIVYGIVKQSGGYIWADSEVERGTTFRIYLPQTSEMREEVILTAGPVHVGGSETILLVEDERDLCEMASLVLKSDGYNVMCAHGGEEAMRLAESQTEPIHLLLTDVVLKGGMNGIELADGLQASRPGVKVLYMSGYSSDLVTKQGILNAESALLLKPFTIDALRLKVREVIEARDIDAA